MRLLLAALTALGHVPAEAASFRAPRLSAAPAPRVSLAPAVPGVRGLAPSLPAVPVLTPAVTPAPLPAQVPALPAAPAALPAIVALPAEAQGAALNQLYDRASFSDGPGAAPSGGGAPRPSGLRPSGPREPGKPPRLERRLRVVRTRSLWRNTTYWAARVTGLYALWTIYRDGVLVQRYAATLADQQAPAARRVTAARLLLALGRLEPLAALGNAAVSDPAPRVQRAAAFAALRLGEQWTPSLTRTLKLNPFAGARLEAVNQLGWLARLSEDVEVLEALGHAATADRDADVRLAAVSALAQAKHRRADALLAWVAERGEDPHLSSAAIAALARRSTVSYRPPAGDLEQAKRPLYVTALKRVLAVGAVFLVVEFVGGMMTGSLALQADAMHMAADLSVTAAALVSAWLARRPPSSRRTYGLLKMEPLVGLLSSVLIGFTAAHMAMEAWERFGAPVALGGWTTIGLAFAGLASNAISTLILYRHRDESLSLKAAFLHAATDALGSLGIIVAGVLMLAFGWYWADPIVTILIVALVAKTTFELARRAWNVLIDAVPLGMDLDAVERDLLGVPGVAAVHDLHVWSLNSSDTIATVAVYVQPGADLEAAVRALRAVLKDKHGIRHSTVQVESLPSR